MVKFLRRAHSADPEDSSSLFDELQIPRLDGLEPADPRALARVILGKIEIIQNRPRKLRLLQTAARVEAHWAAFLLVELLGDPIEEIRGLAVRELIAREDCPVLCVCERLAQPPWFAKSAALQVLAAKKSAGTSRYIRVVTDDPNADVRRSAAVALGEIGGAEAKALLVQLSRDVSPYVRAAAVAALDKICDFRFS